MARPRKSDTHLPPYVRKRGETFWYEPRGESPVKLGDTLPAAMARYYELAERPETIETVAHMIARYIADALPLRKPETQRKYRASLVLLRLFFGAMRPRDVKAKHVYQYLDERRDTPTAANRDVAALSAVFAEGMRWGAVEIPASACIGTPNTRARAS